MGDLPMPPCPRLRWSVSLGGSDGDGRWRRPSDEHRRLQRLGVDGSHATPLAGVRRRAGLSALTPSVPPLLHHEAETLELAAGRAVLGVQGALCWQTTESVGLVKLRNWAGIYCLSNYFVPLALKGTRTVRLPSATISEFACSALLFVLVKVSYTSRHQGS